MTAAITPAARACAEWVGTPRHRHRWQAVITAHDHGPVLWRGADVHAAAITAIVVAEDQLRRMAPRTEEAAA